MTQTQIPAVVPPVALPSRQPTGRRARSLARLASQSTGATPAGKLVYLCLAISVLLAAGPLYYMVVMASRPNSDISSIPPPLTPGDQLGANITRVFENQDVMFGRAMVNSVLVAGVATVSVVVLSALAGFAFAKLRFRGRDALYIGILTTMMIPLGVGLIPNFIIMARIGWVDTYRALIVPGIANAFGIFWMRQYCLSVPDELLDAARVDGAGEFGIFARIVLPVIRPALASLAIFVFLSSWNDFLQPLVFLRSEDKFTVQLWLSIVERQGNVSQPAIVMAGALLASIPIVILFAALQRHFIAGLTAGSVK